MANNNRQTLVNGAQQALDQMKYEIASSSVSTLALKLLPV